MVRYLSWLANAALLTLGCFLVANTANAVFAALLAPSPAELAPAPVRQPPAKRSWNDRQEILNRNLFNASLIAPRTPGPEPPEDLEETQLPLGLLGTVASTNPSLSWAAIEDQETRTHLVVKVNDEVKGGAATVMEIRPKRVVLSENGELRELLFPEDGPPAAPPKMSQIDRHSRKSRAALRRGARNRQAPPPDTERESRAEILSPAQLFSQARILPKWEDGEMVGMQVNAIKSGSIFEKAGIQDGAVITEINGIKIDSPEGSPIILKELSEAGEFIVTVIQPDGNTETMNVDLTQR